jgi:hypothetical protein
VPIKIKVFLEVSQDFSVYAGPDIGQSRLENRYQMKLIVNL